MKEEKMHDASQSHEPKAEHKNTELGLPENIEGLLCYLLVWVSGIVFLVLERKNDFVRFHALQSLVTFLGLTVISFVIVVVPIIGWVISPLIYLLQLVLWIVCMLKAYKGERYKLPWVGDWVESIMKQKAQV